MVFLQLYYIFYGSKGSKHLSGGGGGGGGGGGCNFLLFFFFLGGGGVGGVQILISIETYITCDFSGGGVRTTYPSLDSRMDCPLPCHGLSFLKVSEGLPAGAVGNMCFFFRGWGGGGGGQMLISNET